MRLLESFLPKPPGTLTRRPSGGLYQADRRGGHQSDIDLCEFTRHSDIVELKPNLHVRVPSIELQEWYGVLMTGHYVLTLKRTFACCADGKLNSSNEIGFDVTHANESGTSSEGCK